MQYHLHSMDGVSTYCSNLLQWWCVQVELVVLQWYVAICVDLVLHMCFFMSSQFFEIFIFLSLV